MNLQTSLVCATGPGTSGKSNFYRYLFSKPAYRRHVIFDTQKEFDPDDYNVYRPVNLEYPAANEELNDRIGRMLNWPRAIRPRFIHVADCANFIPGGNKTVGSNVARLIQQNTHIYPGITLSVSARKPQSIDPDLRELADHFFVFGAKGKSTWQALKELGGGEGGEAVKELVRDKEPYQFVHIGPTGEVTLYDPVPDMGEYDRY